MEKAFSYRRKINTSKKVLQASPRLLRNSSSKGFKASVRTPQSCSSPAQSYTIGVDCCPSLTNSYSWVLFKSGSQVVDSCPVAISTHVLPKTVISWSWSEKQALLVSLSFPLFFSCLVYVFLYYLVHSHSKSLMYYSYLSAYYTS